MTVDQIVQALNAGIQQLKDSSQIEITRLANEHASMGRSAVREKIADADVAEATVLPSDMLLRCSYIYSFSRVVALLVCTYSRHSN